MTVSPIFCPIEQFNFVLLECGVWFCMVNYLNLNLIYIQDDKPLLTASTNPNRNSMEVFRKVN